MKINCGCGDKRLPGYVNIDIQQGKGDIQGDCAKLEFKEGSVEEVISFHLLEHLDYGGGQRFIKSSHKMLKPGGKFVAELPNFLELCQKVIDGKADHMTMMYIFGNQRNAEQYHKWGYCPEYLESYLRGIGFKNIKISKGTDSHQNEEECFRIEAEK